MRKLILLVILLTRPASAFQLEFVDILTAQIVGEMKPRAYDLKLDDQFIGVAMVHAQPLVSGGFGLRVVGRHPSGDSNGGLRFSFEGAGQWGRFHEDREVGTVTRGELLTGLGYEGTLGPLILHTATIVGFDYQSFAIGKGASVDQFSLRAGQQVGAHLHMGSVFFLYADGTLDYDGQWRVRAGISIGDLIKRPKPVVRSSRESREVLAPAAP
jgi:hypothetical protein